MSFIKRHKKDLVIQVAFLIIPLLFLIEFIFEQRFHDGDGIFNYSRLFDASIDIYQGHLPQFNLNTNAILGGATNTFYPWLSFLPVILLKPLLSAFTFWYAINSYVVIIGEEASYFAARKFGNSRLYSFTFMIIYTFASFFLTQYYALNDNGAMLVMMLSPLIIYYWFQWIKHDKWVGLTVCMVISIYANIVTPLLLIICLIMMTVAWYKDLSWNKIKTAIKASIVFTLCSAPLWIPICELYFHNNMSLPVFANNSSLQVPEFKIPFHLLFVPEQLSIWTYTDILSVVLGVIYWKKIPNWCKKYLVMSLIISLICTKPIATWLIKNTPFSVFQFVHRFSFFGHLLLTVILVEIIFNIALEKWNSFLILLTLLFIVIGTVGILPSDEYETAKTKNEILFSKQFQHFNNYHAYTNFLIEKDAHHKFQQLSFSKLHGSLFNHYVPAMFDEYYPQSCVDYKRAVRDHHPLNEPYTNGSNYIKNGMIFNKKHSGNYKIPIATFHTQKYLIKVNHRPMIIYGQNKLLQVHLRKGNNTITIYPYVMPYRIFSFLIACLGLAILIYKYYLYLHYSNNMLHYKCK